MKIFADDPLTRWLLALIGLGGRSSPQPSSSTKTDLNLRAPIKRTTPIPIAGAALFHGFAPTPSAPQPSSTDLATTAVKKSYDIFSKIQKLLNLNVAEPLQTVSSVDIFGEAAPLSQVSGGELALDGAAVDFFADAAPLVEVSGGELALAGGGTGGSGGGAGLGGSVAFAAPAVSGEAAATSGAAATGVAAGETITVAGALGPVGAIAGAAVAVAVGVHTLIKALLPRDLPFGRGQTFSAADNMSSQKSVLLGIRGGDTMIAYIKSHPNFRDLIRLANAGANLSPHGEVLFHHPTAGLGASFYNNASPDYTALLQKVWDGDVSSLSNFVRYVEIYTGETGATHPHWSATDWYRRSLVQSVPASVQAQLQPLDTIWQPMPGWQTQGENLVAYLFPGGVPDANAIGAVSDKGGIDGYLSWYQSTQKWDGCPFFRDTSGPQFNLTDDDVARIKSMWPQQYQTPVAYNIETGQYEPYFAPNSAEALAAQERLNSMGGC